MRMIKQLTQVFLLIMLSTFGIGAVYYVVWTAAALPMAWWVYLVLPVLASLTDFGLFRWIVRT